MYRTSNGPNCVHPVTVCLSVINGTAWICQYSEHFLHFMTNVVTKTISTLWKRKLTWILFQDTFRTAQETYFPSPITTNQLICKTKHLLFLLRTMSNTYMHCGLSTKFLNFRSYCIKITTCLNGLIMNISFVLFHSNILTCNTLPKFYLFTNWCTSELS